MAASQSPGSVTRQFYMRDPVRAQMLEAIKRRDFRHKIDYGLYAVRLFNRAVELGFSPNKTSLFALPRPHQTKASLLPMPSVKPTEKGYSNSVYVKLPEADNDLVEQHSKRLGIDSDERIRQSFRFANFVVLNTVAGHDEITDYFLHEGVRVGISRLLHLEDQATA